MPRRWTNHGNHAGDGSHVFPPPTPVRTVDLRIVDAVLAVNAKIGDSKKNSGKRRRRRR